MIRDKSLHPSAATMNRDTRTALIPGRVAVHAWMVRIRKIRRRWHVWLSTISGTAYASDAPGLDRQGGTPATPSTSCVG